MTITYSDVEQHFHKIRPQVKQTLQLLEERIIEGRDNKNIPIYLTKWRIKSLDSIYLKTKRKNKENLNDITDYGGFRILCLFEQDIFQTHEYLIQILKENNYELKEFQIFNWENPEQIKQLNDVAGKQFGSYQSNINNKDSGYKSIHYVVKPNNSPEIEIQLRTLLQDVWSELEHALSYKQGSIHPHIKKSFYLLSRDLQTDDALITHLREISDKEKYTELFALSNTGPYKVFEYDQGVLPALLKQNTTLGNTFDKYEKFIFDESNINTLSAHISQLKSLYADVCSNLTYKDGEDPGVKQWVDMEKAFISFLEGDLDVALKIYDNVIQYASHCYVPYFRKGEILFIKGEIEKSLVSFDKCEEILNSLGIKGILNAYRVKVKLANIYWLMGSEYYDIALSEILEAEHIFYENEKSFNKTDEGYLINNIFWYHLEHYLLAVEKNNGNYQSESADNVFETVANRFAKLEPYLKDENVSSNALDSASWYYFNAYKRTGDEKLLIKAKELCKLAWEKKNTATLSITSINMHRNHTQEIMSTNP